MFPEEHIFKHGVINLKIRKYFCHNIGSKPSGKHMYHLLQQNLPLYFSNTVCFFYFVWFSQ
jgi:hypothetical protein